MNLPQLDPLLFDWSTWRAGSIEQVFKVPHRIQFLYGIADTLRKHAVGWTYGDQLVCRPKTGFVAVMFWVDDTHFWTHLTCAEFKRIWL
jgi:hypothetical protein